MQLQSSRLPRMFFLIAVLLVPAALLVSGCTAPGFQTAPAVDLEATVVAIVDARLTAIAEGGTTSSEPSTVETPSPADGQPDDSVAASDAQPMLITPTPDRSNELMAIVAANTRHFKGDPDAPVVIVEFSDFL